VNGFAGAATGYSQGVRGQDDDDWVGEPPEGRYSRERARPEFWRSNVPLSITGIGLGVALLILLIVWLA
jgi:hypothetical protein